MSRNELLQAALALDPRDRAALANELLESLDDEADPDAIAAWDAEIDRRVERLERGDAVLISAADVMAKARQG